MDLDASFRQEIADAVADSWQDRNLIFFNKQERAAESTKDDRSIKDIILEDLDIISQSPTGNSPQRSGQVSIRILYR